MKRPLLSSLLLWLVQGAVAQTPTVGVLQHAPGSTDDGYVLFAPVPATTTYLLDKCGRQVHSWPSQYRPGQSVYLLPDGRLLRPGSTNNATFAAGGRGGVIELLAWNGAVQGRFTLSDATQCQHHDVRMLPNGNILALVWEARTPADALAAGRTAALVGTAVWSEKLLELQPTGPTTAAVVWEWHAWDHLVQDADPTKANYAPVAQHPELVNVNYGARATQPDWLHFNSIDYNPALDQILISCHGLNEIWVLDHSTTTSQAAGHTGGRSGHGGDLLWRWGNPAAYGHGTAADQQYFGQHNAQWLDAAPYAGQVLVFNNGQGRPAGNYSTVEIVAPPVDTAGHYAAALPYGPAAATWHYQAPTPADFYAQNISGAQRLTSGNVLVCDGPAGRFFELDSTHQRVWEYRNPITNTGPVAQGTVPTQNPVFRATFYPSTYAGFLGQTLTPGQPLELNPTPTPCALVTGTAPAPAVLPWQVWPTAATDYLDISPPTPSNAYTLTVWNATGQPVLTAGAARRLAVAALPAGSYVLAITDATGRLTRVRFGVVR